MKIYKSDQKIDIQFKLNGKEVKGKTYPRTLLSDFIRHSLGETGTHIGCEHGICGACTILLNNTSIRSCLMFAYQADNNELITVEGLSDDKSYDDLKLFSKYFLKKDINIERFSDINLFDCGLEINNDKISIKDNISNIIMMKYAN